MPSSSVTKVSATAFQRARRSTPRAFGFLLGVVDDERASCLPQAIRYRPASDLFIEISNVVWAIERTRAGADGRPREVPPPARPSAIPSSPGAPPLVYRVAPEVPDGYHPYVPHTGAAGIELARASVPGGIGGRVALPDRFTRAAVPARPHQLRRVDELVRTSDGAYHWIRRRVLVATAPRPSVTLQFDQIVDREVPR